MGCSKNVRVLGRKESHVAWDGGVEGGGCLNLAALEHENIFFFFFLFFFVI